MEHTYTIINYWLSVTNKIIQAKDTIISPNIQIMKDNKNFILITLRTQKIR
jgi:hypothetical protein